VGCHSPNPVVGLNEGVVGLNEGVVGLNEPGGGYMTRAGGAQLFPTCKGGGTQSLGS